MLLFDDVLSDDVLRLCEAERTHKLGQACWSLSTFTWSPRVQVGIDGVCAATSVSAPLAKAVTACLAGRLPPHDRLVLQHYVWTRGAGIARHHDARRRFGATIYLNRAWPDGAGGVFMWDEDGERALAPRFNAMVVNDRRQPHWVTPVSPAAAEPRLTLQIWGH